MVRPIQTIFFAIISFLIALIGFYHYYSWFLFVVNIKIKILKSERYKKDQLNTHFDSVVDKNRSKMYKRCLLLIFIQILCTFEVIIIIKVFSLFFPMCQTLLQLNETWSYYLCLCLSYWRKYSIILLITKTFENDWISSNYLKI